MVGVELTHLATKSRIYMKYIQNIYKIYSSFIQPGLVGAYLSMNPYIARYTLLYSDAASQHLASNQQIGACCVSLSPRCEGPRTGLGPKAKTEGMPIWDILLLYLLSLFQIIDTFVVNQKQQM